MPLQFYAFNASTSMGNKALNLRGRQNPSQGVPKNPKGVAPGQRLRHCGGLYWPHGWGWPCGGPLWASWVGLVLWGPLLASWVGLAPWAHPGHSLWVRVLGIPLLVWATRHLGWGPLMSPTLQVWPCGFLGPLKPVQAFGSFTAEKS